MLRTSKSTGFSSVLSAIKTTTSRFKNALATYEDLQYSQALVSNIQLVSVTFHDQQFYVYSTSEYIPNCNRIQ